MLKFPLQSPLYTVLYTESLLYKKVKFTTASITCSWNYPNWIYLCHRTILSLDISITTPIWYSLWGISYCFQGCWPWFVTMPVIKVTAECFKDKFASTQVEGKRGLQRIANVLWFDVTRNISSTRITLGKKQSTLSISEMTTHTENPLQSV